MCELLKVVHGNMGFLIGPQNMALNEIRTYSGNAIFPFPFYKTVKLKKIKLFPQCLPNFEEIEVINLGGSIGYRNFDSLGNPVDVVNSGFADAIPNGDPFVSASNGFINPGFYRENSVVDVEIECQAIEVYLQATVKLLVATPLYSPSASVSIVAYYE